MIYFIVFIVFFCLSVFAIYYFKKVGVIVTGIFVVIALVSYYPAELQVKYYVKIIEVQSAYIIENVHKDEDDKKYRSAKRKRLKKESELKILVLKGKVWGLFK